MRKLIQSKLCWRILLGSLVVIILVTVIGTILLRTLPRAHIMHNIILLIESDPVPTWKVYSTEDRASTLLSYNDPSVHGESLYISATILDVDLSEKTYRLHCSVRPNGTLANQYGQLNQAIIISFSSLSTYHIDPGDADNTLDLNFSYDFGNEIDYPFDVYEGSFEVFASSAENVSYTIPISFSLRASLTSFTFMPSRMPSEPNDEDHISIKIVTGRSTTTVGFSIFICILMWALSLVMCLYGYQVIRRRRNVDAHACMVGLAMLFALPALRSAQPGAPVFGCTSDILSFYWNMAIIAVVSIAVLACWVIRWDSEHEKKSHMDHHSYHQEEEKVIQNDSQTINFVVENVRPQQTI